MFHHQSYIEVLSACGPWALLATHCNGGGVPLTKRPNEDTVSVCTFRVHMYVAQILFLWGTVKNPVILKMAQAVT